VQPVCREVGMVDYTEAFERVDNCADAEGTWGEGADCNWGVAQCKWAEVAHCMKVGAAQYKRAEVEPGRWRV